MWKVCGKHFYSVSCIHKKYILHNCPLKIYSYIMHSDSKDKKITLHEDVL